MPRGARLILDNACYHVISRGNGKCTTYKTDEDFQRYADLLLKYKKKYHLKIYGWCLMSNHSHLIIGGDSLSKAMHGLNVSYAIYFRRIYGGVGHFWQDRFKSYVIEKDRYLLNSITYIEYNPVRAGIVSRPEDYKWSSHCARVLGRKHSLLDTIVI